MVKCGAGGITPQQIYFVIGEWILNLCASEEFWQLKNV